MVHYPVPHKRRTSDNTADAAYLVVLRVSISRFSPLLIYLSLYYAVSVCDSTASNDTMTGEYKIANELQGNSTYLLTCTMALQPLGPWPLA
jgi:hypothetical protein